MAYGIFGKPLSRHSLTRIALILAVAAAVVAVNHAARGHADDAWLLPLTAGFVGIGISLAVPRRR